MLHRLIIGFCATSVCSVLSGQTTFNRVFNYSIQQQWIDPSGGSGRGVWQTAQGYFVLGHLVDSAGFTRTTTYLFDPTGTNQQTFLLHNTAPEHQNFGYSDVAEQDQVGVISAISSFGGLNDSAAHIDLTRISEDGTAIWDVSVVDSCLCGVKQTRVDAVGKVAMVGYNGLEAMLLLTDTFGTVDTMVTFPNTYAALSVRPLAQTGYCIAGFQLGGVDNSVWVMRLDSAGNAIWRRDIGGSRFAYQNVSALQTQDGGIVATCSYMPLPGSPTDDQWNFFRKWDIDGNVQWTKQYNEQNSTTAYDLEELPSGQLVACGAEGATPVANHGILMRLEPDGDLIWLRRYAYYINTSALHIPYDVEPTSDGGFVLTGQAKQGSTDSLPGLQMVWLLKVDSMGCLVPGCGNIGVQEIALGLEDALHVYPNPTHGILNVELSLPADLQPKGDLQLVLVDALGRTVLQQPIAHPLSSSLTLSLGPLPMGVYHLHLRDAVRWLSGAKVVVE